MAAVGLPHSGGVFDQQKQELWPEHYLCSTTATRVDREVQGSARLASSPPWRRRAFFHASSLRPAHSSSTLGSSTTPPRCSHCTCRQHRRLCPARSAPSSPLGSTAVTPARS